MSHILSDKLFPTSPLAYLQALYILYIYKIRNNIMWDESIERQHNEEREQDREARDTQKYDHDEHTPTTYEQADPLLPKMMGAAYAHYFHTDEEIANVEDEVQANYEHDDKYGLI